MHGYGWFASFALIAVLSLLGTAPVSAQSDSYEYCYAGICYQKQVDAENAMRAASVYGSRLKKKKGAIGNASELKKWTIEYTVDDIVPPMNSSVYLIDVGNPAPAYCPPSGDPVYPNSCLNESVMITNFMAQQQASNPACTITDVSPENTYDVPFRQSKIWAFNNGLWTGFLRHNRQSNARVLKWTIFCPGWSAPVARSVPLYMFTSYVCPAGYEPKDGYHPSVGLSPTLVLYDAYQVCKPSGPFPTITAKVMQSCSKPASENPCYPATGDKARFETDFEFSGRSFVRSYHSIRQAGMLPELAPGWVHSYSDRIVTAPSGSIGMIRDDGYIEAFTRVGTTSRYASVDDSVRVLDQQANGTYILYSENGILRTFNSAGRLTRIESQSSSGWKIDFTYYSDRLIGAVDNLGRTLAFQYANDRLSVVVLPDGSQVGYAYDTAGNLQSVQYPDGRVRTYHYNESGYSDANDPHALTGITAEDGQRYATFGYDSRGRVRLSQLHSAGGVVEKTELTYTGDTQATVTTPSGETKTYTMSNSSGYRRATAVVGSGGSEYTTYAGPRIFESRDKAQNITRYEYSTDGSYRAARLDAYGTTIERAVRTSRNSLYQISSIDIQKKSGSSYITKQRREWTYDSLGLVQTQTIIDPATSASRTVTYNHCTDADVLAGSCPMRALLTSVDGPRTDVLDKTTYSYYANDHASCASNPAGCLYRKGQLKRVTNPLGQFVEYLAYNMYGKPTSVQDADGIVVDFVYNLQGWLTAHKIRGANPALESDDQISTIEYWPTGTVKKFTSPDGAFLSFTYDGARRLVGIVDAEGNSIVYTLDSAGNRTQEQIKDDQGVLMRNLSRAFNALEQLQSRTDAYNRTVSFTYDVNENLDQATDPLSRVADNNVDPLNRLSRTLQDMNGIAAETKFSYDVLDNLTQVNDPKGLDTNYAYNGFGDLTQLQSPDTGITTYTYDSAGNRASQIDARGVTTTYGYDALNRLTSIAYPTASLNTGYVYDTTQAVCQSGEGFSVGRLTKIVDGSGSTSYCYDRFGNLVRKVQVTNGQTFTLRYLFNTAGQMTGMVYPDGAVVDYVHDALGRVSEVGATPAGGTRQVVLANATYYPFGPVAEWIYGNGRVMKRSLNQNYQPGFVEVIGPGGLSLGYEFDEVGNLKKLRTAAQAEPPLRAFGYDGLNRLVETKDGATAAVLEAYAYDPTGNRTSATVSGATTAYGYGSGSHRLNSVGATARGYDDAGNTTQIGGAAKTFAYNDLNRMSQYLESGIVKRNYAYNGRGEQVRTWLAANDDRYSLYAESGQWLGEYDSAGAPAQQIVWLGDLPVGVLTGSGVAQKLHYIEADALGTPRVVVDPARGAGGTAVWRWELTGEAFGNTAPDQDTDGDSIAFVFDMRFPGQRYDAASGLNYNYFRDYESGTGRYSQSDPIGLAGGISTYGYVGGNPLTAIDPEGLMGFGTPGSPRRSGGRVGGVTRPSGPTPTEIYNGMRTWRVWGHRTFPGERNSFERHCTVSCILSKKYGVGITRLSGIVNEYQGFYVHDLWDLSGRYSRQRPWAFQPDDLAANEKGFDCSKKQNCSNTGGDEASIVDECTKCCTLGVMYGY
ncbi:RHS repeat-associated core domain-containing protein [Lysobacter hankyongensis]|uniref:RHS repeat-associated core domain-containing protein n=1 Tax=Lysobacter hankyongensis TaxID=1176535 RepID=A0ABP9BEE4_9GAMM